MGIIKIKCIRMGLHADTRCEEQRTLAEQSKAPLLEGVAEFKENLVISLR